MNLLGQVVEILGQECFQTEEELSTEDLPKGLERFLHVYHAERNQYDPEQPAAIRMEVTNNFYGTIITADAIKMMADPRDGKPVRELDDGDYIPDGEVTLEEFIRGLR